MSILKIVSKTFNLIVPEKKDKSDQNYLDYMNHHISNIRSGRMTVHEMLSLGDKINDGRVWVEIIKTNRLSVSQMLFEVGNKAREIRVWTEIVNTGRLSPTEVEAVNKTVGSKYRFEKGIGYVRSKLDKWSK